MHQKLCAQDLPALHLITIAREIRLYKKAPPAYPLVSFYECKYQRQAEFTDPKLHFWAILLGVQQMYGIRPAGPS